MAQTYYPETISSPDLPALETSILQYWQKQSVFKQSVESRPLPIAGDKKEYVFYDGPPFANGLPHYGHLLTSCVKDLYARYHTMKGEKVERRFGWDCHGLPAEMGVEKELGVSGRVAIEEYGVAKFNDHCKNSVLQYTDQWKGYVNRSARWVDFDNGYKTMDTDYMESVIWAFNELYNKGLVYESHRVMPYSWAAETPLSNFETRMDDSYRERTDKAVTVAFRVKSCCDLLNQAVKETDSNLRILAWTTTPWTLPSNLALAVSPDLEYVCVWNPEQGHGDIDALFHTEKLFNSWGEAFAPALKSIKDADCNTVIDLAVGDIHEGNLYAIKLKGSDLLGLSYEPLFPYFAELKKPQGGKVHFDTKGKASPAKHFPNAFTVLEGDFIEEGSGTGIVHLAPGFGEDDQRVCADAGIGIVCPVDDSGCYTDAVFDIEVDERMRGLATDGSAAISGAKSESSERNKITLSLKGLNVIADTNKADDEPYKQDQLEKYGLANLRIIQYLKSTGRLIKQDDYKHSYPHCWRTDTPLIYKAVPSWYVEVTKFKDRMVELNQEINWIPEHIKDGQFGKWLDNARDWSISRNRFWGCPIPIWRTPSGKIKSFGSIAELETFFLPSASENKIQEWLEAGFVVEVDSSGVAETGLVSPASPELAGGVRPIAEDSNPEQGRYKILNLHKPFIDTLTKIDEETGETWTRVSDVFDCWFESGSMPYAQVHYPFENKDWFENNFPADFIVEYVGQTRGWFYTLMVLGTALFDRPPFKNCICHGVLLAEDGKKLSKKLRNYPDPNDMFDQYGADAMRWRMIKEPVMHGGNLLIAKDGSDIRDVVRLSIKPIWNAYHFFSLYANTDGVKAYNLLDLAASEDEDSATGGVCCGGAHGTDSHPIAAYVMDRYILAKLKQAVNTIEKSLDSYDTLTACRAVDDFFEVLNNWYIRRSRERFWREMLEDESGADKQAAYDTLYTVLVTICRAAAPMLPLLTEEIYRGLTSEKSVHLATFPDVSVIPAEQDLISDMDRVRDACNAGLGVRNVENIRIRQPLASLTIYGEGAERLQPYADLFKEEINVHTVNLSNQLDEVAERKLQINFPVLGKRLGKKMGPITGMAKQGKWSDRGDGTILVGEEVLASDEFSLLLAAKDNKGAQALSTQDALVVIDLNLTDDLLAEGIARDVVRTIQQARKDADLNVSDRIRLAIDAPAAIAGAISANADYIKEQTLAESLELSAASNAKYVSSSSVGGQDIAVGLDVAVA